MCLNTFITITITPIVAISVVMAELIPSTTHSRIRPTKIKRAPAIMLY